MGFPPSAGDAMEPANELACKEERAAPEPLGAQVVLDVDSDSSDSASSESLAATSSSEEEVQPVKKSRTSFRPHASTKSSWVVHKKSGLPHVCWSDPSGNDEERRTTACGRTVTSNYVLMDYSTEGNLICTMCQRRQ